MLVSLENCNLLTMLLAKVTCISISQVALMCFISKDEQLIESMSTVIESPRYLVKFSNSIASDEILLSI